MAHHIGDSIQFLSGDEKRAATFLGFDLPRDIRIATTAVVLTSDGVSRINPITIIGDLNAEKEAVK